jgi:DNA-directed RNA polymerase specialized sigma24 family protein
VLFGLVGSREEAEDLAQQTILALPPAPSLRQGGTLTAWHAGLV